MRILPAVNYSGMKHKSWHYDFDRQRRPIIVRGDRCDTRTTVLQDDENGIKPKI